MLYLGHFSYTYSEKGKKGLLDGLFTAVVEADSPDAAATAFEKLLKKVKKEDDLFARTEEVYLESLVEVEKLPKAGFISHCVYGFPEDLTTYCTWKRGTKSPSCRVYTLTPEDEGEEWLLEPFVTFGK